ncbi:hypothetical protein HY750_03105 [Candidatus Kuenenbacteria bacterium]|nr:hypothetical protein [Candidatus Kuenenbacteria bacterium]
MSKIFNNTKTKSINKLDQYAGQWVSFINEKVVTSAETLEELEKKTKKMVLKKEPVYFLVPRKDEGPFILIFKRL